MTTRLVLSSTLGMLVFAFLGTRLACAQDQADPAQPQLTREAIRAKLDETRISFEAAQQPLEKLAAQLAEKLGVPIRIDARGLNDVELPTDIPVTFQAIDAPAGSVLRRMLRELDLVYRIDRHGLEITTPDGGDHYTGSPLVYPVGDLITDEEGRVHSEALAHLITTTLSPESWECLGGPGTMKVYGNDLVVLNTETPNRQVSQLLRGLRMVRQGERDDPLEPITLENHLGGFQAAVQRIRETIVDLPNEEYPLDKLRDEISQATGLTIWIDARALEDVGLTTDTSIQGPWKQVTAQRVLDKVARIYDLDWIVDDGIVLITTPGEAESETLVRIYPVDDLIEADVRRNQAGHNAWHTDSPAPYQSLSELLTTTVEPDTWEDLGGYGSLAPFPPAHCLVVTHTREYHQEIEQLLTDIRANQRVQSREEGDPDPKSAVVIRSYFISYPGSGQEVDREDLATLRQRIMTTIEPQAWEDEGAYFDVYRGRMVVRQRVDIHRQINSYLRATGFYGPPTSSSLTPRSPHQNSKEGAESGGFFPP